MKTALLSAAGGAFALAAVAFSGGAQAECVWNGYNWACPPAPPAYTQSYGGGYQNPQYPAYPTYGEGYPGYQPDWQSRYPGPKLSGH